ncbi:CPO-like [Ectocarpus sp. CCAP 1310/34]|nr:CPO-like [Ectocarpus sp. CCAP 1310/34]
MFEPNGVALDIFGDKETSDARRRCQPATEEDRVIFDLHLSVSVLYAISYIGWKYMPYCSEQIAAEAEALGGPMSLVDVGEGHPEPGTDTPWGLAKAYIDEVWAFLMENDGWNADGRLGGREVNLTPFTGDFVFSDSAGNTWDGYEPKNSPYKTGRELAFFAHDLAILSAVRCAPCSFPKNCRRSQFSSTKRWQPLMESNGLGYLNSQVHVTPHIGVTGRFFGFNTSEDEEAWGARTLDRPPYQNRYDEAAREVLEASTVAAYDPAKLFAISLFDNKFNSLPPLKIVYFFDRGDLSLMDFLELSVKSQLAIYNSVLLAWREKVRHDAPRPTSVIRNELGDELVDAYAGPDIGIQTIKASEWEPYIRTMPHSEYPSGSSCICEGFASALRLWAGNDIIDPPIGFPPPEFGGPILEFSSWTEISQMCGDSRVWAGLHFEEAVPAGAELCGGDEIAVSIAASIDALTAGDESAAVFKRDVGELVLRPL